ncbi:hypothetical protein BASA62_004502 [Batrachochytrium salamandrivorans]|nr:hypothetical protein BASA62_004502 [Batrachochytrium salamandrivorans]
MKNTVLLKKKTTKSGLSKLSIVEPEKKKQKLVDLSTKLAILKYLDNDHSIRATADKFKLSKGTGQSAKQNTEMLLKEAESNRSLSKERIVQQSNINVILWRWFSTARSRGYPISGPILQEKVKQIATQIGANVGEFSASESWLQKWEQRNNVRSYKISGESGNVDLASTEQWKSSLTTMFTGYNLRNVFNMDEIGLFC